MRYRVLALLGVLLVGSVVASFALAGEKDPENVYGFKVKNIDGKDVDLSRYKGKVLLFVNVASKCGYTKQYEGLEALYKQKKDKGLVVLGFPSNDFGNQEPGSNAEIKEFCTSNFNVTFPMFSKISVKGEKAHPLYKWLVARGRIKTEIEWNFTKFLVGKDGKVLGRFASNVAPDDKKLLDQIDKALSVKK